MFDKDRRKKHADVFIKIAARTTRRTFQVGENMTEYIF